jgi:hypothetical protein
MSQGVKYKYNVTGIERYNMSSLFIAITFGDFDTPLNTQSIESDYEIPT